MHSIHTSFSAYVTAALISSGVFISNLEIVHWSLSFQQLLKIVFNLLWKYIVAV